MTTVLTDKDNIVLTKGNLWGSLETDKVYTKTIL